MANTIYRNFMDLGDAEQARNALLADGFRQAAVKLTPHNALPQDAATSTVDHIMNSLTPDSVDKTDQPRPRPVALLAVDVLDEDQRQQAEAIMQRFSAIEA